MPDQANHLAGLNIQADAPADRAVAIAKAHIAQPDAPEICGRCTGSRLGHAGNMVENVKIRLAPDAAFA